MESADRQTQDTAIPGELNRRVKLKSEWKPYSDNKGMNFFYYITHPRLLQPRKIGRYPVRGSNLC